MKNLIFGFILALLVYLFIETASLIVHFIKWGNYSLYEIQHDKMDAINALNSQGVYQAQKAENRDKVVKPILHPYTGYIIEGQVRRPDCESTDFNECYTRIKLDTDKPFAKRKPGRVIVGILGGSFADGLARLGRAKIVNSIKASEQFRDNEIILYSLAHGGYMQPQGLMHLAYYYSLGAEFDLVINIDGFNEISGTFFNYLDRKVHPSFPTYWDHKVAKTVSKEYLDFYSSKRSILKNRAALARVGLWEGVRHSPIFNLYWRMSSTNSLKQISKIDHAVASINKQESNQSQFEGKGPDYEFTDWAAFFDFAADIWADSSVATHAMVEGQGARYLHFLQPNQYIDGNKVLSDWERYHAITIDAGYGQVYRKYRHHLEKKFNTLISNGVEFYDLTYALADQSTTLYIDNCCHMNALGYSLIVDQILARALAPEKALE